MKTSKRLTPISAAICGALFASQAAAGDYGKPNPYLKADDSLISISGTVVAPAADSFRLDYGTGVVLVEMDDWDSYGEAYNLIDGDQVTVYGRIDDDLFERTSIEAGSVYVDSLNTFFYASSADEEGLEVMTTPYFLTAPISTKGASVASVRGTVTRVDKKEQEIRIRTGNDQTITVEVDELGYNPLDKLGYQKISLGDRVSVTGQFDFDFLEGRKLEADTLTTLNDASNSTKNS